MTVTTTDIERLAIRVRAEFTALVACAPAHADLIATAVLARIRRDLQLSGDGLAGPGRGHHRIGTN